jgi:hypothetical protein
MRVDAVVAGKSASFDVMRNVVQQDWTDAVMAEQRTGAVRKLATKYKIRFEGSKP